MVEVEPYNSVRKFKPFKSTSLLISGINVPFASTTFCCSMQRYSYFLIHKMDFKTFLPYICTYNIH